MSTPSRSNPSSANAGALAWWPALGYLAVALGLVVGGLVFLWFSPSLPSAAGNEGDRTSSQAPTTSATVAAGPPRVAGATGVTSVVSGEAKPAATAPPVAEGNTDPTRDLSSYVMRGQKPTMPEVIERLHQAGIHSGLGAFSPPGTRPALIGLAVPEDFVLPDGYVRHHQATDDGQRIEAILMFAPDRQFFDTAKRPIVVPQNRVVPPEYAPPGLPIRRIVLPKPIDPAGI